VTQVVDTPTATSPALAPGSSLRDSSAASSPIQLNAFQRLMRRWSQQHPYNAGQVMRVSGIADRKRWKEAVEAVIGEVGLGRPRFQGGDQVVVFVPVDDLTIEQSSLDVQAYFNEELNRPFGSGELPIRFAMLPAPPHHGQPSHYFAAVYDHWIADSRAMRELMCRIFERYQSACETQSSLPPLTLSAPPFKPLFRKHVGRLTRWTAMRESLKNLWRHRHGYRLNLWNPLDFTSRFVIRELPEGLIDRLYRFAKSRSASVNDLFIAVIAQTMGTYTADERLGKSRKLLHFARRGVGIGTIVDIRDAASQPLDRVFNLYLSSYTVLLKNPEQRPAADVMGQVARETSLIKKTMSTVKGFWALEMARFGYDVYDSPRFRAMLLHKTVPVVAGISNVNMTGSWADPAPAAGDEKGPGDRSAGRVVPQILDYLRISPTGPLIPVVFTLTTIRGRLSLCVTFRTQAFHENKLHEIVQDFIRRLEELVKE
jgi:hypothetical protein